MNSTPFHPKTDQSYSLALLTLVQSTSLQPLISSMYRVLGWLRSQPTTTTTSTPVNRRTRAMITRRINTQGLELIKRFEGYPPEIEPNTREAEQAVRQLVQVPLTANQFSALVSFTFHVGETTLKQSDLLRLLNAGRYRAAAKEFDRWVYIGSQRFSQLVARRVAERGLFLKTEG